MDRTKEPEEDKIWMFLLMVLLLELVAFFSFCPESAERQRGPRKKR
jgi:hypothetical protein